MRCGVVLLAVGAAGCAFHDVSLRLPPSVGTGLSGGDSRQVVVVVPFADQRSQPNRCGMQKNSYNMETASAICSEPPAAWLANLLASELRAAGFSVVTQADRPSAVRVEGTLLQLFVEPVIGFSTVSLESDLQVKLVLTSATGLVAERTFFVKNTQSGLVATPGNFQKSVDEGSRQVAREMVAAILSLLNRYPQLGKGLRATVEVRA